jgi:apolipoprotein D and lipocalin family protein
MQKPSGKKNKTDLTLTGLLMKELGVAPIKVPSVRACDRSLEFTSGDVREWIMRMREVIVLAGLIGAAAGLMMAGSQQPLETVRHVDLSRYVGRWFEIARYSNRFERKCDRDVTAEYSLKENGQIRVVNACVTHTGKVERSEGTAKIVDTSTNSKLKVTFFWPFYGKYWIIGLGDEYEYAVVGEPSRQYLWILSRTPVMQDAVYQNILHQLTASRYEPQKLVKTTQTAATKP